MIRDCAPGGRLVCCIPLSAESVGSIARRHIYLEFTREALDAISGISNIPEKQKFEKESRYKKEISSLKRDLTRKEKALAETAALLVLKKKAQAIWGEPEED